MLFSDREKFNTIATRLGLDMAPEALDNAFEDAGMLDAAFLADISGIDDMPIVSPYYRSEPIVPSSDENPYNAWQVKGVVQGASHGPLYGRDVVLKDNIGLAGFPMLNGATALEGYVADFDATIVTRLLDAGARIVGKARCEYYCVSGGSHTSAGGAVHNPHRHGYTSGGSSSGCAALVGAGEIDLAIGGDQGGSIRVPSSFCGVYGLKPTFGLVPYSGIFPIDQSIDYAGPMTTNTRDNALLLSVVAGPDGLDPRQQGIAPGDYLGALGRGVKGLRIGFLLEGFAWDDHESDVYRAVNDLRTTLAEGGATIVDVSVPDHAHGFKIWLGMVLEGFAAMMHDNALGTQWRGYYPVSLGAAHAKWRDQAHLLPENVKFLLLVGTYLNETMGGTYYARSQNLARKLRRSYDDALQSVDLLIMPTSPIKAPPLPDPVAPTPEQLSRPGFASIMNSAAFNASGHPAMNVPVAMAGGLPIGAMLVGRYWDEAMIYRVSDYIENAINWRSTSV